MGEQLIDPQMRKSSVGMKALKEIGKENMDSFVCGKL